MTKYAYHKYQLVYRLLREQAVCASAVKYVCRHAYSLHKKRKIASNYLENIG